MEFDHNAPLCLVYFLYPETMGVPLEEMDAVFGEGMSSLLSTCLTTHLHHRTTEELEQQMEDEESERASLVSRYSRQSEPGALGPGPSSGSGPRAPSAGFVRRLLDRLDHRSSYQPINDGDE